MSKYRIFYCQNDEVKYISHLDFLRTINRVFKRAELPLKFSMGFNPHTVMTIGLPLSVGTTSECDVLDLELAQDMDTEVLKSRINGNTPIGIHITKVVKNNNLKPLFNIDSAVYEAEFTTDKSITLDEFLNAECVLIDKKSKRGITQVNIKDFIRSVTVKQTDGTHHKIDMHINAGSFSNLKPELLLKAICSFYGTVNRDIALNRKAIYFDDLTPVC